MVFLIERNPRQQLNRRFWASEAPGLQQARVRAEDAQGHWEVGGGAGEAAGQGGWRRWRREVSGAARRGGGARLLPLGPGVHAWPYLIAQGTLRRHCPRPVSCTREFHLSQQEYRYRNRKYSSRNPEYRCRNLPNAPTVQSP